MSGLLCAGNVHAAILNDDGSFAGFLGIKNAIKLAISPGESEEKQRVSKQVASYGQVLDSVVIPGKPMVTVDFDEGDAETIGLALQGNVAPLNLTTQTRTAVDLTVTALDTWLELGDRYINPTGFLLKDNGGVNTLVQGVDYVVDLTMGLVKFLASGTVEASDTVEKTYTTRAVTGSRISGSKKNQLRMRLLLNGKNLATGKPVVVELPSCTLRSASTFDPLLGEFAVTSLTGTIVGDYSVDHLDA
ncbi:hypothetical protein D0B54_02385 [Solimonas sp. K1W22B-7]|uniref:phage tail tube protein n=1 Tax=Solimonas sp. K1W22B-7 TaxID=2303331 RepID=UPI000E3379EE|nr:hypothetical protein [Solimonas sp. K1W22B-7]AXQ27589.1 hypothetical protein D0B54_02385 [Solimonas sp. K1W22B-7]